MIKNLRKLRLAKGISQQQLADAVWVTQQSINKYENHNIEPDIQTMIRIADYFNTSIDYLVGHTDIERMIETVKPYDLNSNESALIDNYRTLSEKQKNAINILVSSFND